ncbi:MAG TPA: glycosyltransferase [Quisquiliibacterium sp.]|nr:glycosyltransferase [Quisquiliibacterium sp.]
MFSFSVSLLLSLVVSVLILRWASRRGLMAMDHDLESVQKMHARPVPRIGGLAVFIAASIGTALIATRDPANAARIGLLCACAVPAFAGGLAEDLTKRITPWRRMACMALSCGLAFWTMDLVIPRVDIDWLDPLIAWKPFAIVLTLMALLAVTNAINIIDGFNGLAGVVCSIMFLALGYVGLKVGDAMVVSASLVMAGSIIGFLVWNYPRGHILMGDGGAYFVGFMLGALSILIVARNPSVSAWFPVLLMAYPLVEIAFSVYRRRVLRGTDPHLPDAAHLHQLIFRRVVRWAVGASDPDARTVRNALTAPYLWVLSSLTVAPAALWFDRTPVLASLFVVFCVSYVWLYFRIVRLKVPRWMVFKR